MKLRTKIASAYITLTVAAVIVVSTFASWQIKKSIAEHMRGTVVSQVDLVAGQMERGILRFDSTASSQEEFTAFAATLGVRLTLVNRDGVVVFDSSLPTAELARLENHGHRPEIEQARSGKIGIDQRHSSSLDRDFLYAARRLDVTPSIPLRGGFVRVALGVTEAYAIDQGVQTVIWTVGLLTIAVIIVVTLILSGRVTRPILQMSTIAQQIKEGDVGQRIPVDSQDEIGDLANAINDMAGKLSSDIERLKKLERVRREFLGNVSHELRTPIFSIQGFIETLLDGAIDDPAVNRDFLEKAHTHATRLNSLLNDLIEISRIESGDMKMSFRFFSLREFLQQITEEMLPLAARKQIRITCSCPADADDKVYGDRERLRQVLVNLIDNAVKYTEPGGSVETRAEFETGRAIVHVGDTGPGIAPEHLPRIFERFYRVDRDRSRAVGGTGLGLAIAKHIVEAHGGTLSVKSAVGSGSTFAFSLKR